MSELSTKEIGQRIYVVRGHRVMLDSDLAQMYGVETGALKRAVRRNIERFPGDFMFQLTAEEHEILRCQIGISKQPGQDGRGGTRFLPFVFTQKDVAMLSSVLKSKRAIQVHIMIMRAFVSLRALLGTDETLVKKLDQLERKYDHQFKVVFDAIRQLMEMGVPASQKRIRGLRDR